MGGGFTLTVEVDQVQTQVGSPNYAFFITVVRDTLHYFKNEFPINELQTRRTFLIVVYKFRDHIILIGESFIRIK